MSIFLLSAKVKLLIFIFRRLKLGLISFWLARRYKPVFQNHLKQIERGRGPLLYVLLNFLSSRISKYFGAKPSPGEYIANL